jgi:hypothetical protein
MKLKWIPIVAVLVIGLTLAGCGAGVEASTSAGGIASKQLSDAESLALGTLKLEDTAQAVDAAQAAELLPLWKAAQSLSTSQTISTMEMEALYTQIREAMTPEQIKAIDAMDFTVAEITEIKSSLGVGLEAASVDTAGTSTQSGGQAGAPADGMGAPPDAAGMPAGMEANGFSPQGNGTSNAATSTISSAALPTRGNVFLEPLISMLKEKAATASN